MQHNDAQEPADPDRVLEEMDEAAEVDQAPDAEGQEAVERAWEESDAAFEGEAPSG